MNEEFMTEVNRSQDNFVRNNELKAHLFNEIEMLKQEHRQWLDMIMTTYNRHSLFYRKNTSGKNGQTHSYHVPITYMRLKALHALLVNAAFAIKPLFVIKPTESTDQEKADKIGVLLTWALTSHINKNKGAYPVLRDWIYDACAYGFSVVKLRWELIERESIQVELDEEAMASAEEELKKLDQMMMDTNPEMLDMLDENGNVKPIYKNVERMVKIFDGLMVERINPENMLFPAEMEDPSDLNEPHFIARRIKLTRTDILDKIESGFFDSITANELLTKQEDGNTIYEDMVNLRHNYRGISNVRSREPGYEIYECYFRYPLKDGNDQSNYKRRDQELICWYSKTYNIVIRGSYLSRVSPTNNRHFYKFDLNVAPGSGYSIGVPEQIKAGNDEIDAMHNGRIEAGLLANKPFAVAKAGSFLSKDLITMDAGEIYEAMDTNDLKFIPIPFSPAWGFQEEASVRSYIDEMTGINSANSGITPSPAGSYMTATGTYSMMAQKDIQLNVVMENFRYALGRFLKGVVEFYQLNLPPATKVRLIGPNGVDEFTNDGKPKTLTFDDRSEIAGDFDITIIPNSSNMNREVELQRARQRAQQLLNPYMIQSKIVTPLNAYYAQKDILEKDGVVNPSLFITKPEGEEPALSVQEEVTMCIEGKQPPVVMADDHQDKIQKLGLVLSSPQFKAGIENGIFNQNAEQLMMDAISRHENMNQIVRAQAQNQQLYGVNIPSTPGAKVAGAVNPQTNTAVVNSPMGQNEVDPGQMNTNNISTNIS